MPTMRDNATRVKRFRELKATLRTNRDRLLVGIDIAKAEDVAQVRHAHTQILDKALTIPNTQTGFARFWAHLQQRQAETGVREIVCAVEPTGTYHEALAQFLDAHGVDVVLVSNTVAHHNRRTLDGTWGKSDPKDAHNLCDLLERGHVLFYSRPDDSIAALRRLVRLLRHARTERAAGKARFRNTLLPALGPAGAAPRARLRVHRPRGPAHRGAGPPRDDRGRAGPSRRAPPGVPPPPHDPGDRAHPRGHPPRGDRGHRLVHQVQPTPEARRAGHHRGGNGELDGDRPDLQVRPAAPPVGSLPGGDRGVPECGVARPARGLHHQAARGPVRVPQGQYRVGGEAPAPRLGRVAEGAALCPELPERRPRGPAPPRAGSPRGPTSRSGAGRDR